MKTSIRGFISKNRNTLLIVAAAVLFAGMLMGYYQIAAWRAWKAANPQWREIQYPIPSGFRIAMGLLFLGTAGLWFVGTVRAIRRAGLAPGEDHELGPRGMKVPKVPMPCGGSIDLSKWSGDEDMAILCSHGHTHSFAELEMALSGSWMREERVEMRCGGIVMLNDYSSDLEYVTCSFAHRHSTDEVEKALAKRDRT